MAAFFRHGFSKTVQIITPKTVVSKNYATKAEKKKGLDRKPTPKFDAQVQSIAAKGFLRPQKDYIPPQDLESTLSQIFKTCIGSTDLNTKVSNLNDRFKLLLACSDKLGHSIPNSLLHQIETLEDVVKFYATPVDTRTPLDKLQTLDLPENLHIQFEYKRFIPDKDTMFEGQTAFPESSTLVTGLKYKNKYEGHRQKVKFPEL